MAPIGADRYDWAVMAKKTKLPLIVTLLDRTKRGAAAIGKGFKRIGQAGADAGEAAKEGFEAAAIGLTGVNSALEIGKKVWETYNLLIEKTVTVALEHRDALDQQRHDYEALQKRVVMTQAALGDLLIPVILGVADAVDETTGPWNEYLEKNREVISVGIIEFLQETAELLTNGVATGIKWVSRGWTGMKVVVAGSMAAVAEWGALTFKVYDKIIGAAQRVANAMGMDSVSDKLGGVREVLDGMRKDAEAFSDHQMGEIEDSIEAQTQLEGKIHKVRKAFQDGIGKAAGAALERVSQGIRKVNPLAEDLETTLKRLEARNGPSEAIERAYQDAVAEEERYLKSVLDMNMSTQGALQAAWDRYYQVQDKLSIDRQRQALEALKAAQQELLDPMIEQYKSLTETVTSLWGDAFEGIGELQTETRDRIVRNEEGTWETQTEIVGQHTKSVGDAFSQMFGSVTKMAAKAALEFVQAEALKQLASMATAKLGIATSAAEGGAKAVSAHANIPFIGLALGVAAAAAIVAAALGFDSFHAGGTIPGVGEGLYRLIGGEEVVTRSEAPRVREFLDSGGRSASAGVGSSQASMLLKALIEVRPTTLQSDAETEVWIIEKLAPILQRLIDEGRLDLVPNI